MALEYFFSPLRAAAKEQETRARGQVSGVLLAGLASASVHSFLCLQVERERGRDRERAHESGTNFSSTFAFSYSHLPM